MDSPSLNRSNTVAILIHGFNVRDGGKESIGKLQSYLETRGVDCIVVDYHWLGVFGTYAKNNKIAKRIAKAAKAAKAGHRNVIALGHSNGCAILNIATKKYMAPIDRLLYVNPALDRDQSPGSYVKEWHVWYSPGDLPVKIGKLLPKHPWGEMGAKGYKGKDDRVQQYNKQTQFPVKSSEHSDVFRVEQLTYFGPMMISKILAGMD